MLLRCRLHGFDITFAIITIIIIIISLIIYITDYIDWIFIIGLHITDIITSFHYSLFGHISHYDYYHWCLISGLAAMIAAYTFRCMPRYFRFLFSLLPAVPPLPAMHGITFIYYWYWLLTHYYHWYYYAFARYWLLLTYFHIIIFTILSLSFSIDYISHYIITSSFRHMHMLFTYCMSFSDIYFA